jgi:short-subunit dehydrogenase
MQRMLIIGASRGLGLALAEGLPAPDDRVWVVSRSEPPRGRPLTTWIRADLREPRQAAESISSGIGDEPLDAFIYNAGIWEKDAFGNVSEEEIIDIVNVNLTSLLLCLRRLLPKLQQGSAARVVLIGSTCGLENEGSSGVAYVATKFAVRGVAHAARELLRAAGVGVTCISPGSIATDVSYAAGRAEALKRHAGHRMPMHDIVSLVRWVLDTARGTCPKEIDLPSLFDSDV